MSLSLEGNFERNRMPCFNDLRYVLKAVEVQINALPIGAEVRLDGELIGNAPVSAKARPGSHEVILSYPDYVTTSQHFEVPRGTEEPFPVHVSMERAASASRTDDVDVPSRATRAWDDLLGTGLAVVGVALVASPLITLARSRRLHRQE